MGLQHNTKFIPYLVTRQQSFGHRETVLANKEVNSCQHAHIWLFMGKAMQATPRQSQPTLLDTRTQNTNKQMPDLPSLLEPQHSPCYRSACSCSWWRIPANCWASWTHTTWGTSSPSSWMSSLSPGARSHAVPGWKQREVTWEDHHQETKGYYSARQTKGTTKTWIVYGNSSCHAVNTRHKKLHRRYILNRGKSLGTLCTSSIEVNPWVPKVHPQ